jgi:hypothetical protein
VRFSSRLRGRRRKASLGKRYAFPVPATTRRSGCNQKARRTGTPPAPVLFVRPPRLAWKQEKKRLLGPPPPLLARQTPPGKVLSGETVRDVDPFCLALEMGGRARLLLDSGARYRGACTAKPGSVVLRRPTIFASLTVRLSILATASGARPSPNRPPHLRPAQSKRFKTELYAKRANRGELMGVKSDGWIRRMAQEEGMIEPFAPGQVRRTGS